MRSYHEHIADLHRTNHTNNEKNNDDDEHARVNRMDISDTCLTLPWKDQHECEELLKRLVDKKFDPIKRRHILIELQWLTNKSDECCHQLFQCMLQRCRSTDVKKFINNLNEQSNTSLVILGLLMRKNIINVDDMSKLIDMLKFYETQGKSIFGMKIKDLKRLGEQAQRVNTACRLSFDESNTMLTMHEMLNMLCDYYPMRDYRIEKNFLKFFQRNRQHVDQCQQLLMNILVEAEDRLSESTIGMILDRLESIDYTSSR
jgi:hypothetical protein